jgi:HD-GYP domain-containing protein (c-di-GMP phosphodiesterase class II)
MRSPLVPTSALSLLFGAAGGALLVRERRARGIAERFAAASLETLLNAIDANDAQTGAHVRRVAAYSLVLAQAADLSEHEQRSVERIALFHDIGKMHEALFDITHDHSKLNPEERRAIATHPQRGAKVLAPLAPFYPDLAPGVLAHHERWDGRGYPRGLRGRAIPLATRIVSIADTFDAITHDRRYRLGTSPRAAATIIAQGRGTQFDPELVDLMLTPPVFEQILKTFRSVRHARAPTTTSDRRAGRHEPLVADVTFRWRPESLGSRPRGPAQQRSR